MWVTANYDSSSKNKELTKDKEVKEVEKAPIIGAGSAVRKNSDSEDKKVNQPKSSKKRPLPKTTLEILMEED